MMLGANSLYTEHLDVAYDESYIVNDLNLSIQMGKIAMVVHELNHAARYAQYMVAIQQGQVIIEGAPEQVMTQEMLRKGNSK